MSGPLNRYLDYTRGKAKNFLYKLLFSPLGLLYEIGVSCRNFAYDHGINSSFEPSLPVISVGNITMGGPIRLPSLRCWREGFWRWG